MADRSVHLVDDNAELPEVNDVKVLTKTVETVNSDPWSQPAEAMKALDGQSPGFKRHLTAEVKKFEKFQRGTDGTESKQIHEKQEFLSGYDAYEVVEPVNNLESLAKLYEISAPHHAAVDAKVANIVALGHRFIETPAAKRVLETKTEDGALAAAHKEMDAERERLEDALDSWNEEDTFTETLIKVWRDYETMGNGYLEIGRKKDGTIGYVGHIPAQTMRVRRKRDGFVQMTGFKVQFFAHYDPKNKDNPKKIANPIGGGLPNEVIHLKRYSPTSGYYGVPDILAAQQAIAGNEFAARFNLDYFENKAVPRYAIILKGATLGSNAESALLSFFETGLKGQNHRSIYIPLPADTPDNKVELKLEAIEAGVQDSSFNNYRKANLADILMVHRVPVTKVSVSEGASLAVAKDADKTFKEQVCEPEQKIFEKKLNKLIKELTDAFELKLEEMSLTDENTQSQIDERYLKQGVVLPNEVRQHKGWGGIDGGNERIDPMAATKQKAESDANAQRTRDATRASNQTDSAPGGGSKP